MTWSILRFNMVNLGVSSPVFIWFGNPFVHQNAALPTMDDLPHLVACFQVKRSWFDVLRCKGNWESHSDKSAPKSLGMWTMLWCWSRDVLVIYALSMIYIILIWVNWMGIYQENRRWTWTPKKSHRKFRVETSPFRGGSRCLLQFPSLVCPPFVSSRYGASEKSMARWMKLYWGKGFSIANMITWGVGCSKGFFSINACICSTLFPLISNLDVNINVFMIPAILFICLFRPFFSFVNTIHHNLACWTA